MGPAAWGGDTWGGLVRHYPEEVHDGRGRRPGTGGVGEGRQRHPERRGHGRRQPADHRPLGLRLGVGLCPKRRVPPGYRPRAARWGGRQALVPPGLDGERPGSSDQARRMTPALEPTAWARPRRTCPKAGFRALQPVALADVTTAENIRASYRVRATGPSATSETRRSDVSAPQPSWEGRITRHGGPWRPSGGDRLLEPAVGLSWFAAVVFGPDASAGHLA